MKKDKDGSESPEVKSPSLVAPPPTVSSLVVDATPPAAPPPEPSPTVVKVRQTTQAINRVVAVVGMVIAVFGFVIRSGIFKTGLGKHAYKAEECRSGKLLQAEGGTTFSLGGICTKDCAADGDCGGGLRCLNGSCAPIGTQAFGQTCSAPWDCQSNICAALMPLPLGLGSPALDSATPPPQMTCTKACANGDPCPEGYDCMESPSAGMLCAKHRDAVEAIQNILNQLRNQTGTPTQP